MSVPLPAGRLTRDPRQAKIAKVVDARTFYHARLWHSFNIRNVLQEASKATRMQGPVQARQVEDALVHAFWNVHGGVLMPPRLVAAVAYVRGLTGGRVLVTWADEWMQRICRAQDGLEGAERAYGVARAEAVRTLARAPGSLDPLVAAVAELLADYLLLQRALAEDVRESSQRLGATDLRATVLAGKEQAKATHFLRLLKSVLTPADIFKRLPAGADAAAKAVAGARPPLEKDGVFTKIPGDPL